MLQVGPHEFTTTDARRTFANLGLMWAMHVQGIDDVPQAAIGQANRIVDRLVAATGLEGAAGDRTHLEAALTAAGRAADRCIGDGSWDAERTAAELGAAWGGIRAVGDDLRAAGLLPTAGSGTVIQLSTSGGGVPKLPVDAVDVDWTGVIGDRQAARQHHGRPWQALSIWSREVIADLAADGHAIRPGAAGENITLGGLDWSTVRPGVRLRIGTVRCELSAYALPCSKNAQWFTGGDFEVIHWQRGPVSRAYATVLEPGSIRTGDIATFEP